MRFSQPSFILLLVLFYRLYVGDIDSWLHDYEMKWKDYTNQSFYSTELRMGYIESQAKSYSFLPLLDIKHAFRLTHDSICTSLFALDIQQCGDICHFVDLTFPLWLLTSATILLNIILLVGSQGELENTNLSLPVANEKQCEKDFIDWILSKAEFSVACLQWWQGVSKMVSIMWY